MSNSISRRDFLKGTVAGAAGIAAMGVLSACGSTDNPGTGTPTGNPDPAPAAAALFKAGTYSSIQSSSHATVEVTCTFSASALTDVRYKVLRTAEADYFTPFASLVEQYCQRIVEAGKTEGVDGVAGASISTTAIREGVNDCTAQALGLPGAPAPLNPQDDNFDSFNGNCDAVFSPIKLGSMTLRNRTAKSSGSGPWEALDGSKITSATELYGTMAENGLALNILPSGASDGTGITPDKLDVEDEDAALATIKPLVDRIHNAGGLVGLQICYGGRSPKASDAKVNEITVEKLDEFIEDVGVSAARAKQAGLDCLEIKGASDDNLNGFLTRRRNHREDEYGPSPLRAAPFCSAG